MGLSRFPGVLVERECMPLHCHSIPTVPRYLFHSYNEHWRQCSFLASNLLTPWWYQIVSWVKETTINILLWLNHYVKCFLIVSFNCLLLLFSGRWFVEFSGSEWEFRISPRACAVGSILHVRCISALLLH